MTLDCSLSSYMNCLALTPHMVTGHSQLSGNFSSPSSLRSSFKALAVGIYQNLRTSSQYFSTSDTLLTMFFIHILLRDDSKTIPPFVYILLSCLPFSYFIRIALQIILILRMPTKNVQMLLFKH